MTSLRPLSLFLLTVSPLTLLAQPGTHTPEFFETKVRPILANNCYGCHTDSALGGLRVDSGEALMKGGKKGPAVVAGDPDKSPLIEAVRHTNPKFKMPMGGKLKDEEIRFLEAWVKAGAVWPKSAEPVKTAAANGKYVIPEERRNFWSFQPLKTPAAPTLKNARWARTQIDKYVLAKLEQEGLKPVRPASKRDLIRRAYLNLTGLPPTFEEIQDFEKDPSPNAFEKVVDKLLASPHYGERWGRYWLDVARFGEDDYRSLDPMRRGYNPYPNAHVYRDWVIQAFNDDLPFDQFVKAQLAGDLMDEKLRHKTLPGTGFLGLGPWYYDNGAVEVTRADERHDRVDVVTRGFLGLTVGCARCHDHKYDPIPMTDYYALAGVFLNTNYHEYPMVPADVHAQYKAIEEEIEQKNKVLREMQTNLSNQLSQSLAFQTANYLQAVWEVNGPKKMDKAIVVENRKLDYELLDRWTAYMAKETDKYAYKKSWQALMKDAKATPARVKKEAEAFQEQVVKIMLAKNELAEENEIITAKSLEGTKKKKRANKPNEFITNDDFCPGCGLQLKNMSESDMSFWTEVFQRELSDSDDPNAMMGGFGRMGKPGVLMFRGWGLESRVGAESQAMMAKVKDDIDAAKKKIEPYYPYLHGVRDSDKPANIALHKRGDPFNLGDEVPRHFLSVLSKSEPKPFSQGSGRLELAGEIAKSPLAARVFVNRVWKGHFGTGLVDTPSNFGLTGEKPAIPELLEYLASSFSANGMSTKKLHREIMLSSVYQLSADTDKLAMEKDPANRWHWRANRKRLDAEQIRDSILFAAGNLDDSLGGPSAELTPTNYRRTVYGKVSRYKLDQYLQLWDFPSPNISAEKRFVTTVPLQRLFLMNSDFVQIEAEELAKRVAAEPDNRARIRKLYQILFGRLPAEQEIVAGIEYLKSEPMLEYEESRKRLNEAKPGKDGKEKPGEPLMTGDAKPAPPEPKPVAEGGAGAGADADMEPAAPNAGGEMGMGMMGGVMSGRGTEKKADEVKYEPSAWGRYAKVLISSSEFMFVN